MEKKINATEKFCTKCGKKFVPVGREVICPACKQAAAEETKRAAVERAKRASWTGESVPVRISGRASTVIRRYGAANGLPFAQALDALLQASEYFGSMGKKWEEVEPYKSHRRDKSTATSTTATSTTETAQEVKQEAPQDEAPQQEAPQDVTSKPQEAPQEAPQASKQAAKTTSKASATKKVAKTTSKAAGKKGENR